MSGDHDRQLILPFNESADPARPGAPAEAGTAASRKAPAPPRAAGSFTPLSLRAFAERWHASTPAAAIAAACGRLRERSGQQHAPYALTPMLDVLSARRADSTDSGRTHGRLHATRTGWTVYRRTDMSWRRVRFTEAHEIAHILIYETLATNSSWLEDLHRPATHQMLEQLCDIGATELLIPAKDMAAELRTRPLETIGDYQRIYDRYLVSHLTLLRRVCEVMPNTALTTWTWGDHAHGADWRVASSYTQHLDRVYIPRYLSRRRLAPDVIVPALEHGAATAAGSLDTGSRRFEATMTAIRPLFRAQTELPVYQGHPIRDEPGGDIVYVVHRDLTPVIVRRPRFPRRRAS